MLRRVAVAVTVGFAVSVGVLGPPRAAAAESSPEAWRVDGDALTQIEAYLEGARIEAGWPGLSAAVVVGGDLAWARGFGAADVEGRPVTPETPFLLASVSKQITATAVVRLADRGLVDLDAALSDYVPELGEAGAGVTVRDAMVQTTGLSRMLGRASFANERGADVESAWIGVAAELDPDAGWEYSNANYDLLALVAQRATGSDFEAVIQEEVAVPLGMTHLTTDPERAKADGLATGWYHWLALGYRPFEPPLPDGMQGGYRMFASPSDVAQIARLHLGGGTVDGTAVLSDAAFSALVDGAPVQTGSATTYAGGLWQAPPGQPWMADEMSQYGEMWHDGDALSYRTYVSVMPGADLAVVLAANANDWADPLLLPRAGVSVQRLLFGLEPIALTGGGDPFQRWGKHLVAALVLAQAVLGVVVLAPLRRAWQTGRFGARGITWLAVAAAVDLAALAVVAVMLPEVAAAPLATIAQAPDARILLQLVALGIGWGVLRSAVAVAVTLRVHERARTPAPT